MSQHETLHLDSDTIGPYRILGELGRGASSIVYRAKNESRESEGLCALKVLHPHLQKESIQLKRFEREAQALMELDDRGLVRIYDYAQVEGRWILAMELIEGRTLAQLIETHPTHHAPEFGAACIAQVAKTLQVVHAAGLIHRDIKPENIMIARDGCVKLMDFGIALGEKATSITATGALVGSPAYLAPELLDADLASVQSDIFALGGVFAYLVSGERPFEGNSIAALLHKISRGQRTDLQKNSPFLLASLRRVVDRCLRHEADTRYASAEDLRVEIESCLSFLALPTAEIITRTLDSSGGWSISWLRKHYLERLKDRKSREDTLLQRVLLKRYKTQWGEEGLEKLAAGQSFVAEHVEVDDAHQQTPKDTLSIKGATNKKFRLAFIAVVAMSVVSLFSLGTIGLPSFLKLNVQERSEGSESQSLKSKNLESDAPVFKAKIEGNSGSKSDLNEEGKEEQVRGFLNTTWAKNPVVTHEEIQKVKMKENLAKKNKRPNAPRVQTKNMLPERATIKKSRQNKKREESNERIRSVSIELAHPAEMWIDDTLVAKRAKKWSGDLRVGTHQVRVMHPLMQGWNKTISLTEADEVFKLKPELRTKPALLRVRSNIDCDLWVSSLRGETARKPKLLGTSMASVARPIVVAIESGRSVENFEIIFSKKGYQPLRKRVWLSAGKTKNIDVTLEALR